MSLCRCHPAHRCGRCPDAAEALAQQIAADNDRCGHVENNAVCLRMRNHAPPHTHEPIERVIPFG